MSAAALSVPPLPFVLFDEEEPIEIGAGEAVALRSRSLRRQVRLDFPLGVKRLAGAAIADGDVIAILRDPSGLPFGVMSRGL